MAGNDNLHMSKNDKADEFYTQLSLIEKELKHYKIFFKDKVVLCNCDDPFESNFFKYFAMNFNSLGLKKLIATCYATSPIIYTQFALFGKDHIVVKKGGKKKPYKIEITEVTDENQDGRVDLSDVEYLLKNRKNYLTLLKSDGDFRSEECIELLQQADVVVTNPPFSLFREYVAQLEEHQKRYIIIGNMNAVTYKEIFPMIAENRLWLGYNSGHFWFKVPKSYEVKKTDFKIDENGQKWRRMGNICWFTNIDIEKRHENMVLFRNYLPEKYPKYDNFDAIEVSRTADIPCDYYEAMGVPITFLDKYNPEQFEFLGIDKNFTSDGGRFLITVNGSGGGGGKQAFICSSSDTKKEIIKILKEDYGLLECDIEYRSGIIGVPVTFMQYYSPEQFEIVGKIDTGEITEYNLTNPIVNGKPLYKRIAIRRKMG